MGKTEGKGISFLKGFLLGALSGAGLFYFLTSTGEGKRVKEKIKKQGKDILVSLAEIISQLEKKGEEFKKKAIKLQQELEEETRRVSGKIADGVKKEISQIGKLRQRSRKAVKFFTRNGKPLS